MTEIAALRVIVVDDERLARDELAYLLGQLPDVEIVGQAADGVEALGLVEDLEPDVLFLDVQMPGLSGFETARRIIGRPESPEIVFVTAFDQYAVDAFAVDAVDYLLKPVEPGRLEQTVDRARRRVQARRDETLQSAVSAPPGGSGHRLNDADLERIVQLVAERQARRDRLALKVGERLMLVHADEILHASLAGDTITVVTGQLTGVAHYRTLDELQAHLDPTVFWRVHRSHLVNINKIKEIVPWFSRNFLLRMKDAKATEIPVSRAQTKRLRDYLKL